MDKSLESSRTTPPAGAFGWRDRAAGRAAVTPADELSTLTEHLQVGVLAEDRAGRVRLTNRQFCQLLCAAPEPEMVTGRPCRQVAREIARQLRDPADFLAELGAMASEQTATAGAAREFERRDGRVIALSHTPVAHGAVARLWQCQDVTEQRRSEERLRALAQTDELTGLPNRRYVLEELGREIARFRRGGGATSVLMIDLDGFKQINDLHGHARGDRTLCDVAAVLTRRCRTADTAARLGGDEFLVLVPETGREGCCEIGERLIREIRATGRGRMSVSIGATTLAHVDAHVDSVLARVDRGLYAAKESGRDCLRYVDSDHGADSGGNSGADPETRHALGGVRSVG